MMEILTIKGKKNWVDIKIVDIQRGMSPRGYEVIYYRFSDRNSYCRTYGIMTPEQLDDYEALLRRNSDGWVRMK